jgi:hypothetical protein
MSWFDALFGVKVAVKVRRSDGSVLERRFTLKQLRQACDDGWDLSDMAQVHMSNADGSYSVWFHDRADLSASRGVLPVAETSLSNSPATSLTSSTTLSTTPSTTASPPLQPLSTPFSMASAISPLPR